MEVNIPKLLSIGWNIPIGWNINKISSNGFQLVGPKKTTANCKKNLGEHLERLKMFYMINSFTISE